MLESYCRQIYGIVEYKDVLALKGSCVVLGKAHCVSLDFVLEESVQDLCLLVQLNID